jgi:hypothetical protein
MPNLRITLHSTRVATRSEKIELRQERNPAGYYICRWLRQTCQLPHSAAAAGAPALDKKEEGKCMRAAVLGKKQPTSALCHANWIYPLSN